MELIDNINEQKEILSSVYSEKDNIDFKNQSIFDTLNNVTRIIPKDAIYQNELMYDIANNYDANYINRIIEKVHGIKKTEEINKIIDDYRKLIDIGNIDIMGAPISFYSNVWDLSCFWAKGKSKTCYIFRFKDDLGYNFGTFFRIHILMLLYKYGPHATSIKEKHVIINNFLSYLRNEYGLLEIEDIELHHVKDYLEKTATSRYHTTVRKMQVINGYFNTYSLTTDQDAKPEIKQYLQNINLSAVNAEREQNKTPLLPGEFYKKYTDALLKEYMDNELPKNEEDYKRHQCMAALALVTRIGIRTEEVTLLQKDCIREIKVNGEKGYYIQYFSTKPCRSKKQAYEMLEIPINSACVEIIEKVKEEAKITHPRSKYLFEGIDGQYMRDTNIRFCFDHRYEFDLLNRDDAELFCTKIDIGKLIANKKHKKSNILNYIKNNSESNCNDILSVPTIKQSRVYAATFLRKMGASDDQIRKIFGHKAPAMNGYYVRDDHPVQEDLEYSVKILNEIIGEDLNILGPKGKSYKDKILEYAQGKDISVKENLDKVIEDICNQMPIRSKLGGFCIKANPNRPCNIDADTDEFTCAYNMCPNHCFLYFMLPESYVKCKNSLAVIEYNRKNGFERSAEKEAYILKNEIEKCLEIEIKETENEIAAHGKEKIIKYHPEMEYYVNNIDKVKEEVESWKARAIQITELN